MQWNIVDGCLVSIVDRNEIYNVPEGIEIRDGKIVSIRFPDGIHTIVIN